MRAPRNTQRGVVLFIALIVLVAMTLAGLGMMRSVDTNNLIAGNLAFKNAATSAGDAAIEAARTWIAAKTPGQLETNQPALGYFANWDPTFDPSKFDWAGSSQLVGTDTVQNNTIRYVAHRMCNESDKSINATNCAKVANSSVGTSKGLPGYGNRRPKVNSLAFYRITAKIEGPKFTVSYLQAFVY
jgi:Tfp pilus assembly protein PilX